jgi:prepilin signal peptidase PulO-like enzyme (type II secretory pathway)
VAATDLERRVIPNEVIVPATVVALVTRSIAAPGHAPVYVAATIAAFCIGFVVNLATRHGLGMGDVKLIAFIAAIAGPAVIGAVAVASLSIFPFAIGTVIRGGLSARKATLPFGPFLAFGALVIIVVPHAIGA